MLKNLVKFTLHLHYIKFNRNYLLNNIFYYYILMPMLASKIIKEVNKMSNNSFSKEVTNNKMDTNYVGVSFHELSEAEMTDIIGGNDSVEPNAVSPLIIKSVVAATKAWCVSAVSGLISYRHC